MSWYRRWHTGWLGYGAALAAVLMAALVREKLLGELGPRLPYVTFFPAVILSALYGGMRAGLLATALSAFLASYWIEPVGKFAIADRADWLGMALFVVSGAGISIITAGRRRAQARACAAEAEILIAGERALAAEAVRQSQEDFQALADTIPQLSWMARADGWMFWYNRRCYEYTGACLEQLKGWGWRSVIDPEALPRVMERWLACIATGEPFDMDFTLRGGDGVFRPFLTRIVPVRGPDGRVARWCGTATDITEREGAVSALRLREAQLRQFVEQAPSAIIMLDRDMRYLAASNRWFGNLGVAGRDILGRSHYEVVPDIPERWRASHRRGLAGAVERAEEDWFERADGTRQCFRWEVRPWREASGEVGGIVIFNEDITAHKLAGEALSRSEQRYAALFANKINGIAHCRVITDPAGRPVDYLILQVNEAYERIVGIGKAAVEGRRATEAFPGIEGYAFDYIAVLGAVGLEGGENLFEAFFEATGQYLSIYAYSPAPGEFTAIFTDVTERRQAEERLRLNESDLRDAQRVARMGSWHWDLATGAVTGSEEFYRIYALDPAQPFPEFNAQRGGLYTVESWERKNAAIQEAMRQGTGYALDLEAFRGEASIWVTARGEAVRDAEGRVVALRGTVEDITERKGLETALTRAKEEADLASQAKSAFLANMSHEIRTPMNAVLGMAALALVEDVPPRAREYLQYVRQAGKALLGIINDVLDLSKIESGKAEIVSRPFRFRESLEAALALLSVSAERKGLAFTHSVGDDVPDHLTGDQGRLRQVLTNLVGNAVKFSTAGTIRVEVAVDGPSLPDPAALPDPVRLLFTVRDEGMGIPKDKLEAVFEAFSQVGLSSHVEYGGTGLGLSICKSLVEMMGGRIWAESTAGKGSAFFFTALFGRNEEAWRPQGEGRPAAPALSGALRILLAEDDKLNRILAVELLTQRGHAVEVAVNGREAIGKLVEGRFDVVLMDVRMPVMDGVAAMRAIRRGEAGASNRGLPIVALTAHALKTDRERFLDQGMDGYLSKPIDLAELDLVLEKIKAGSYPPHPEGSADAGFGG